MKFLWVLFSVNLFLSLQHNIILASDFVPDLEEPPATQPSLFPENAQDPRIAQMSLSKDPLDPRFEAALIAEIQHKTTFEMLWKLRLKLSPRNQPVFWRHISNFFANPKVGDFDFLIALLAPETCCPWPKVLARIQRRKELYFQVNHP